MFAGGQVKSRILASFQDGEKIRQLKTIFKDRGIRMNVSFSLDEAFRKLSYQCPDMLIVEPVLAQQGTEMLFNDLLRYCQDHDIAVILVADENQWPLPSGCQELPRVSFPFVAENVASSIAAEQQIRQLKKELARSRALLEEKEKELAQSFESAAYIQRSLIPQKVPNVHGFSFDWQFLPTDHGSVGGDLFNILHLDEHHLGVYILDVCGHDFPAAMVTISISQALHPRMSQVVKKRIPEPPFFRIAPPSEVLTCLNAEYPLERFEKYFTICYAVLDMRSGKVCYSNAGHPLPVLVRRDGGVESLAEGGTIVGLVDASFPEGEVAMGKGDRLYFYTDGIVEHQNDEGAFYGPERLYKILAQGTGTTLNKTCKKVISNLRGFAGQPARDDITLLGIEYHGS